MHICSAATYCGAVRNVMNKFMGKKRKYFFFLNDFHLKASRTSFVTCFPTARILPVSERNPTLQSHVLVPNVCGDMLLELYVPISLASLSNAGILMFRFKTKIKLNCI